MTSMIVLSKNYSESRWCLNELLKILECMEIVKQSVLPVFYDVDPSEVRNQKGSFGEAFAKLKDRFEGNEEVLKWKAALEKLANMSGVELKNYRKESEFIEVIIQWVELRLVNETPLSVAKYLVGIECCKQDIYQHLSLERNDIIRTSLDVCDIDKGINVIKHRLRS
ncbi:disease resistance protein RLM3-like [Carya illinoinensis]|uniref:disease resistance protein RLM3-like n=1 Tax=Carya illinoinensis TaxID=32201 RepID=UPI001C7229A2|nr:disease resistance protein RLM3-like [Carya illinoinensis]